MERRGTLRDITAPIPRLLFCAQHSIRRGAGHDYMDLFNEEEEP